MQKINFRYVVELTAAILAYAVVLIGSITFLNNNPGHPARIAIALTPMLPALLVPIVVVRFLRRLDEMQRRIQIEAMGIGFALTAVITFGYGFLETVGFPPLGGFVVWPIMSVTWMIGRWIAGRRYA